MSQEKFVNSKTYKRNLKIISLISIILMATLFFAGYSFGNPSLSSTIEPGSLYKNADYIIFRDSLTYYALNGHTGVIDYSSSNASGVIYNVINSGLPDKVIQLPTSGQPTISAPCGSIYFPSDWYNITDMIEIPLGSRIKITGDGTTMQPIENGQLGGTQIRSTDPDGCLIALDSGTLVNGSSISSASGSSLIIRDIEFYQTVEQTNSSVAAVDLNGMAQGALDCVSVTSYQHWGSQLQGYGLVIYNYGVADQIQFNDVKVYGFNVAMSLTSDHLLLDGIGVGCSSTALQIKPMPHVSINELHIFQTNKTIQVAATSAEWDYMHNLTQVITNLYIEECGTTDNSTVWLGNHGMRVVIDKCQATKIRSTVWTPFGFENRSLWEFHKVNVNHALADADYTTPEFPDAYQPAVANNTDILAYNPCITWLFIDGGTVNKIWLNGYNTGLTSGAFLLRPKDYVKISYEVAPTTWKWRNFDVDADG